MYKWINTDSLPTTSRGKAESTQGKLGDMVVVVVVCVYVYDWFLCFLFTQ